MLANIYDPYYEKGIKNDSSGSMASAQLLLESVMHPGFITNNRMDVVEVNAEGAAFLKAVCEVKFLDNINLLRQMFLNEGVRTKIENWEVVSKKIVSKLRYNLAKAPSDRYIYNLVDELCLISQEFKVLWDEHDVIESDFGMVCFSGIDSEYREYSHKSYPIGCDGNVSVNLLLAC